jgi:hypothetical protein
VSTPSTSSRLAKTVEAAPEGAAVPSRKRGRPKGTGAGKAPLLKSPADVKGTSDAKKSAAVILEVLAGERLTRDAAAALGISDARYYAVEARAIQGLVAACEPRRPGRQGPSPAQEHEKLRRENVRLERQCARLSALVRATQRSVGVAPPVEKQKLKNGKKRKARRPVVRALVVAAALRVEKPETPAPASAPASVKEE